MMISPRNHPLRKSFGEQQILIKKCSQARDCDRNQGPPPGQEVTPAQATPDLTTGSSSSSRPGRSRSRVERSGPSAQASFVEGAHWTELVHDTFPAEPEVSGFWTEPTAAVSVSIEDAEHQVTNRKDPEGPSSLLQQYSERSVQQWK